MSMAFKDGAIPRCWPDRQAAGEAQNATVAMHRDRRAGSKQGGKPSYMALSQHRCHEPPFRLDPKKHLKTLGVSAIGTARNGCSGQFRARQPQVQAGEINRPPAPAFDRNGQFSRDPTPASLLR